MGTEPLAIVHQLFEFCGGGIAANPPSSIFIAIEMLESMCG